MLLSMAAILRANAVHIESDTIPSLTLKGVEIVTQRVLLPVHRLSNVHGNILVAGKKNEVIELSKSNADLASVNQRQIFARVPGLMIWESDGSGVQIGIAARGLSPNRSWEFNTRQNGYDITPDVFGYPEAYYTPPMEAVERIEFMRGAACSLHSMLLVAQRESGATTHLPNSEKEMDGAKIPLLIAQHCTVASSLDQMKRLFWD